MQALFEISTIYERYNSNAGFVRMYNVYSFCLFNYYIDCF